MREGLRYVGRTPGLLVPLIMLALIGTLAYEFQVVLPLLATGPFGGDAATYGVLTSAMGAGAIVGGLVVAGHGRTGLRPLTVAGRGARRRDPRRRRCRPRCRSRSSRSRRPGRRASPSSPRATRRSSSPASPASAGRVMALWTVAFLGSTPIGAPIVGAISEHVGPRAGLAAGAAACLAAAAVGALALARAGRRARAGPRPARRSRPATAEASCWACASRAGALGDEAVVLDDEALVRLLHQRAREQEVGRRPVAGDGRVVDDRHPQQRLDVDVVRLRLERVPEEDHEVDAPLGDRRADLLVAAERAAEEARDRQAELARDQPAGRAGGEQLVLLESAPRL